MKSGALLPAEQKVLDELGHLPLDFRAMWAISNVFRSSTALRRHLEATVLAPRPPLLDGVHGSLGPVDLGRDGVEGVRLGRRHQPSHRDRRALDAAAPSLRATEKGGEDGRVVLVSLTPSGRRKIEELFPRFNAEEAKVAAVLIAEEQERLASMLRTLLLRVEGGAGGTRP